MSENKKKIHTCDCDCVKPEVRIQYKEGCCSEEQIVKCHGAQYLNDLKEKEGEKH
ncbi:MAG: hypothetical protein ACOC4M_05765 [Promethearchaeia archaeon]